jgi:hypothetical protein
MEWPSARMTLAPGLLEIIKSPVENELLGCFGATKL